MADPISTQIAKTFEAQKPSRSAAARVVEGQRAAILDRTFRGVDGNEKAFHPYSTKGPYYWSPNRAGKSIKQQKASIRYYLRQTNKVSTSLYGTSGERSSVGGVQSKTGLSIRFESYADFKQSFGRGLNVDLFGIENHTHMLNTIVVRPAIPIANGFQVSMGIYGSESDRATGHIEGTRTLPVRNFWITSEKDLDRMQSELEGLA